MKRIFDVKTIKFIIVGLTNTAIGMGIMYVLYNVFHYSYWTASATNYIITSILSYALNKRFTFEDSSKITKSLWKFVINIGVCYLIAYGIAKPMTLCLLAGYTATIVDNVAMFVGMVFFTGLNYFGQRFFVFSKNEG